MEENQISEKVAENTSIENTPEEEQTVSSPFLPSYTKSYSETLFESATLDHTWKIHQFRHFCEIKNTITFPSFPEIGQCEILMKVSRQDNQIKAIQFYILTCNAFSGSCTTTVRSCEHYLSTRSISGRISNTTLLVEFSTEKLTYGLGDALIIHCKFEIFRNVINKSIKMNLLPSSTETPKDVAYFEDSTFELPLTYNYKESVKLQVGILKYYVVSKKLLCATNSSYFKHICDIYKGHPIDVTEDNPDDELEHVPDDQLEAFEQILVYILTGSIKQCYEELKNLLIAAYYYDVQTLKLTCEHYLLHHITVNNAVELIRLALEYNAKFLATHSATFIKFNIKEIRDTEKFLNLPRTDLSIIMELIEKSKIHEVSSHQIFSSPLMTDEKFSLFNHII